MKKVTRQDIAEELSRVGDPGKKPKTKLKAVEKLFKDSGATTKNSQGVSLLDEIKKFKEF